MGDIRKKPEVIVFLDSDIRNLTAEWVDRLVNSIGEERYDRARGTYPRAHSDSGVTNLVAKLLLYVF